MQDNLSLRARKGIFHTNYGIEFVKLKSKRPSAKKQPIETLGFLISLILIIISRLAL